MNFRLIVEYHDTGVITEQYFPDMDTPDTIINYLDNALENGALTVLMTARGRCLPYGIS